jgi:hypothetical protein
VVKVMFWMKTDGASFFIRESSTQVFQLQNLFIGISPLPEMVTNLYTSDMKTHVVLQTSPESLLVVDSWGGEGEATMGR